MARNQRCSAITHPLRPYIFGELHSRPPIEISAPARLVSIVVFFENNAGEQWEALARVIEYFGLPSIGQQENFYFGKVGQLSLQWSLHTEFSRFTVAAPMESAIGPSFSVDWHDLLAGQILAVSDVLVFSQDLTDIDQIKNRCFDSSPVIESVGADGGLRILTDFMIRRSTDFPCGVTRYVLFESNLNPRQIGALVQKIIEIEGYLCLIFISLPIAKSQMVELDQMGLDLRHLTALAEEEAQRDVGLLKRLENLAAELERHIAHSQYRFSASHAYHQLVVSRIQELDEQRLPEGLTLKEFIFRRLAPAMQTCETVEQRQEKLALRLQRTASLLRTRVEVNHEEQNREVLARMAQRAELQLRLQQTVEGLSIWVLTYYALGLLSYGVKAAHALGLDIDPSLVSGAALPIFAVLFWRRVGAAKSRQSATA